MLAGPSPALGWELRRSEPWEYTHAHCQGLVLLQPVPPPGFSRGFPGLPGARRPAKQALCIVFCILSIADEESGAQSSERWRDLPERAQPATELGSVSGAWTTGRSCCVLGSSLKSCPRWAVRGDPGSPHLTGLPGRKEVKESILWIRPHPNLGTSTVSPPIKGTGPHLLASGIQFVLGALGHLEPSRSLIPAPSCCPSHLST